MQQVTIIGLGLIGGSIGLALKRWSAANGNALSVVGFDEDMDKQSLARKMNAVDSTEWALGAAVKDADVVILATPVGAMQAIVADISEHLKNGAVVTDTGSTKSDVLEWAKALPTTCQFVGGHPMAGKSESLEAADADLFAKATWVVCPSPRADDNAIRTVLGIIGAVGAEAYFVDPAEHDAYVGGISHLPLVVAAALVRTATGDTAWRDMQTLSASGFRDTTRLALGSPKMHRDILMTNRDAIVRWIDQMIDSLGEVRGHLTKESDIASKELLAWFEDAQDERARLETPTNRAAEQAAITAGQVGPGGIQDQMGRMFLGGFGRRGRGERK